MSAWTLARDAGRLQTELARFIADYCAQAQSFERPGTRLSPHRTDDATREAVDDYVRSMPASPQALSSDADITLFVSEVIHEWIERSLVFQGDRHARAREIAHDRVGEMVAMLGERLRKEKPPARPQAPAPASSLRSVFMSLGSGAQSGGTVTVPPQVLGKGAAPSPPKPDPDLMQLYRSLLVESNTDATQQLAAMPAPGHDVPLPDGAGDDLQIFHQLRLQLETYIKRACISYGLRDPGGDPIRTLDVLRASRLVDEAGLRIAEAIFALCARVISVGRATVSDYREAMLLYLLYHRGHLGA